MDNITAGTTELIGETVNSAANTTEMVNNTVNGGGIKMNPVMKTTLKIAGMNLVGGIAAGAGMVIGNVIAAKIIKECRKTPEQRELEREQRKEEKEQRKEARRARRADRHNKKVYIDTDIEVNE